LFLERREDGFADACRVRHHVGIPEPQHTPTLSFQCVATSLVMNGALGVLAAIKLEDEFGAEASEVCDVRADWVLSAEFVSGKLPRAQHPPHFTLCCRRLARHRAGTSDRRHAPNLTPLQRSWRG